jgi:ferredoxin
MRVTVDRQRCKGYTICNEMAPMLFEIDENGLAYVADNPPAELHELALKAQRMCPERAIAVTIEE